MCGIIGHRACARQCRALNLLTFLGKFSVVNDRILEIRWALARLAFIVYIIFSVLTLIGGFLTAPLMTWYFFRDWRFWRHWRAGVGLLPHGLRLAALMLSHRRSFMFSVPLTSSPRSAPDPSASLHRADWEHGESCGGCFNCCTVGGNVCPLHDKKQQGCRGYNSFYWRYFNCGRYPSFDEEIHYYNCRKWVLSRSTQTAPAGLAAEPVMSVLVAAPQQQE